MPRALGWDAEADGLSLIPVRVLRPPVWRFDEEKGLIELQVDRKGVVAWMHPRVRPILESLRDGVTLPEIVATARREDATRPVASIARSARSLIAGLVEQGNLRIEAPAMPELLDGRFRLLRELGRGGVGIAWLCVDAHAPPGAPPVVVKHAWNWSGPLPARDARIRAEADTLARLYHRRITRLIARFEIEGRHHVVRSFAPGEDLSRAVVRDGPPPPETRALRLREAGEAIAHMHARGFLLLDVNPGNFILREDGSIELADVGHARPMDAPLKSARWGADGYVAPDVHIDYSTRADVYGLGALAVFLATARPAGSAAAQRAFESGATREEKRFVESCCGAAVVRPATVEDALSLIA